MRDRRTLSHLEQQRKDREDSQKREYESIKQVKKNHQSSTKNRKKKTLSADQKSNQFSLDKDLLAQIEAHSKLLLDRDENQQLEEKTATSHYIELATLMVQAAASPGVYLTLSWPIGFEWPGLAHAIACRTISANSLGEHGLRMAFYPALQSNYGRYRRARFPLQSFLHEARSAASISKELSSRHLTYMHFNQLENDNDPRKHPALANTISLFEWNPILQKWGLYGDGYFSDVRIALHHHESKTRAHKAQIAKFADTMANPDATLDATFRIKRNTKPAEARKHLLDGKNGYNLIVIDARQNILNSIPSWRNSLGILLEKITLSEETPATILLTDTISTYQYFTEKLKDTKKQTKARISKKPSFQYHWLRYETDLWHQQSYDQSLFPSSETIKITITEAQSLFDISKINDLAKTSNAHNPDLANELRRAGGFLRRLVDFPVGQKALGQWFRELAQDLGIASSTQLAARYLWKHYQLEMQQRIDNIGTGNSYTLKRFQKIADRILARIQESTSIERETIEAVYNVVTDRDAGRILVLVKDHHCIRLLEESLKSAICKDILEYLDIEKASQQQDYSPYHSLIVAGVDRKLLVYLLTSKQLPNSIRLICDAYTALTVYRELSVIQKIEAFTLLHERITLLLEQIEPQLKSYQQIGNSFELPDSIINESSMAAPSVEGGSTNYAQIYLSGIDAITVGKSSTIIKVSRLMPSGYQAVTVDELTEGDQILILSDADRKEIADILKAEAGRMTQSAIHILRAYFQLAKGNLQQHFTDQQRTQRARAVLRRIQTMDSDTAEEIAKNILIRWIKHIEGFTDKHNIDAKAIKTHSPRDKKHFLAFTEAIGFDTDSSQLYWNKGIHQLRTGRILEGRRLGKEIYRILIGSSDIAELHMQNDEIDTLFTISQHGLYPVELIIYKDENHREEYPC